MAYNHKLLSKFNLIGDAALGGDGNSREVDNMMSNPDYLRQSSSLINDALQKGFDVLQLADGDIVTTGVKTVVYQYRWDDEKQKLVRVSSRSGKQKSSTPKVTVPEDESV